MQRSLGRLNSMLTLFGLDLRQTARTVRALPAYRRDLARLKVQQSGSSSPFPFGTLRPCLGEDSAGSGLASGHYFHQDLLVAGRIFVAGPARHIDVGSRVDGFVAHVATFRPIDVLDIRPLTSTIRNVNAIQADVMAEVPESLVECCDSLSCLHALEHFGLGRYGDPLDHDGYLRGLDAMYRMLQPEGTFYLSVPIGPQRIEFNAHRVFSVEYLLGLLTERYRLDRFSFVDDRGDLHDNVNVTPEDARTSFGCNYGCGIFELTKLQDASTG